MAEMVERPYRWWSLAIFVVLCLGIGSVSAAMVAVQIPRWYVHLVKPGFNPPNWVFGPVWTVLYILMAVAAWLVVRQLDSQARSRGMGCFYIQLLLNFLWPLIFFGRHALGIAGVEILVLLVMILLTVRYFWPVSTIAALLLTPYVLWVMYASVLNWSIWRLNR